MQITYCLSARRALCYLLLAAGCGAALARALPVTWAGGAAVTAQSGSQTSKEKNKI
jgi:hypothetical protein